MNLCSSGHDEICYEGRNCPACLLLGENAELKNKINILGKEIDALDNELANIETKE